MGQIEKQLKGKVVFKHETEAVWHTSNNGGPVEYVPAAGEKVLYDRDSNHDYTRIKYGDGTHIVAELPFSTEQPDWLQTDETAIDHIKNKPPVAFDENGELNIGDHNAQGVYIFSDHPTIELCRADTEESLKLGSDGDSHWASENNIAIRSSGGEYPIDDYYLGLTIDGKKDVLRLETVSASGSDDKSVELSIEELASMKNEIGAKAIANNKADKTVATTSADGLMSKYDKQIFDAFGFYTSGSNAEMLTTNNISVQTPRILIDAEEPIRIVTGGKYTTVSAAEIIDMKNEIGAKAALANYVPTSQKGKANGVASLDANGKVPSTQLPSYVDDVLEYSAKSSFPTTGETGKIYVDTTTNKTYRWSGSAYIEISASLALGETSSTAYAGDKGKATTNIVNQYLGEDNLIYHTDESVLKIGNSDARGIDIYSDGDILLNAASVKVNDKEIATVDALEQVAAGKVDKVEGKGLSDNNYTDEDQTKLSGIEAEANKTIVDTALSSTSTNPVQNKVINTKFENIDTEMDALNEAIDKKLSTSGKHLEVTASNSMSIDAEVVEITADHDVLIDGLYIGLESDSVSFGKSKRIDFSADDFENIKNEIGLVTAGTGEKSTIMGADYNGIEIQAAAQGAHAQGGGTQALADAAHAEGVNTVAGRVDNATAVTAAGTLGISGTNETKVLKLRGFGAHAEGFNTQALGTAAHAEGNVTKALANATHAEGDTTEATGEAAHSEGYSTRAIGNQSHSEGLNTTARGNASHTEGRHTNVYAKAAGGHAEGIGTGVSVDGGHAEGVDTLTSTLSSDMGQHVQGRYNDQQDSQGKAFVIGGGVEGKGKNIHTVDWGGNAVYTGTIETAGIVAKDVDTDIEIGYNWQAGNIKIQSDHQCISMSRCGGDDYINVGTYTGESGITIYSYDCVEINAPSVKVNDKEVATLDSNGKVPTAQLPFYAKVYGPKPSLPLPPGWLEEEFRIPIKIRIQDNEMNGEGTGNIPYYRYVDRELVFEA